MKAAYIEKQGGPDEIRFGDLPEPILGPGEVLVKVGAAALNPIDLYLRSGIVAMPIAFPYVVGADLAGTVVELGPGASRFRVGDRVWGSNQSFFGRQGVAAEFGAVAEDWLYSTPANLSDLDAAAMAMVGITAHLGLFDRARLRPGETVYVAGGAGGVGSMVVQIAKIAGARVATSAGREETLRVCRDLGADLVVNYKEGELAARLRAFSEEGIDVWYETQREPDLETNVPLLKRWGRMVLMAGRGAKPVLPLGTFYTRNCSILGFAMFNSPPGDQREAADEIAGWASEGKLRPVIGKVFPLEAASQAHAFLEENTMGKAGTLVGKVVLEVAG
jgi:NADPH2:quinone reductase